LPLVISEDFGIRKKYNFKLGKPPNTRMTSSMTSLVYTILSVNINRKVFHQHLAKTILGAVFEFKGLGNPLIKAFSKL